MLLFPLLDTQVTLSSGTASVTESVTLSDGTRFTTEGWLPPGAEIGGRIRWQSLLAGASYALSPYALLRTDSNQTTQHLQHRAVGRLSWRHDLTPLWAIAPGLAGLYESVSGVASPQGQDPRDTGRNLTGLGLGLLTAGRLGPGIMEADLTFLPIVSASPLANRKVGWDVQWGFFLPAFGLEWGIRLQSQGSYGEQSLSAAHGLSLQARWSPSPTE